MSVTRSGKKAGIRNYFGYERKVWSVMRTIHFRALSIGTLALFTLGGVATAQTKSSAVLNTVELQQLIKRAEPADHARLSAHFAALAEWYTAEAKRHTSMSQSFVGNPSRQLATGMSAHCKRLAELDTQSATAVRELAAHHEKLAAGTPSAALPGSARFEGGAGAPGPSEKELDALAAKAGTPADHRVLEEYFLALAKRYTADAEQHVAMAQTYRGTRIVTAAVHCDDLAKELRDAAKEANAAATMHKQLSGISR